MVAQVSLSNGIVRVNKGFCAIDLGIAINPDSIEAQLQGGIIHRLSATLWGEVKFTNGVPNVVNYGIVVTITTGTAAPGRVGKTGVPAWRRRWPMCWPG